MIHVAGFARIQPYFRRFRSPREFPYDPMNDRHDYLRRLPAEYYRGQAYVHWTMTIENRRTGWLTPIFYYKFQELLTHTAFRYGFCCPIFCLMPDHMHLLSVGIVDECDQRIAQGDCV